MLAARANQFHRWFLAAQPLVDSQHKSTVDTEQSQKGRKSASKRGLHAAWAFNGHFINSFGPLENLTEESAWEEQLGTGAPLPPHRYQLALLAKPAKQQS